MGSCLKDLGRSVKLRPFSWEQRKLGDIAKRVTRKNEGGKSDLPLTISAQYGLVDAYCSLVNT